MDHFTLNARLEIMKWRDDQFEAVTEQLESALPYLLDEISETVAQAGIMELAKTTFVMRRAIERKVQLWSAEQAKVALHRAEITLDRTLDSLGSGVVLRANTRDTIATGLRAGTGASIIVGSIVAIPSIVALATVTTGGVFGLGATSAVSFPFLAIGGLGVAVLTLTGSSLFDRGVASGKKRLQARVARAVERQVMGYGLAPGERSTLSDIQAMILVAAERKLEGSA